MIPAKWFQKCSPESSKSTESLKFNSLREFFRDNVETSKMCSTRSLIMVAGAQNLLPTPPTWAALSTKWTLFAKTSHNAKNAIKCLRVPARFLSRTHYHSTRSLTLTLVKAVQNVRRIHAHVPEKWGFSWRELWSIMETCWRQRIIVLMLRRAWGALVWLVMMLAAGVYLSRHRIQVWVIRVWMDR